MKTKTISDIFPINQKIFFHSGNFIGHYGTVKKVENESKHPKAIFGFMIYIQLDNGEIVFAVKSEHIRKI